MSSPPQRSLPQDTKPSPVKDPPPRDEEPVSESKVTSSRGPSPRNERDSPKDPESPSRASSGSHSSRIEPDSATDDFEDDGYPESSNTSYLTSIASDIRRGIQENGRTYGVYGLHKAWIPSDDEEVKQLVLV